MVVKPGASFSMRQQAVEGNYAYILWSVETVDNTYESVPIPLLLRTGR